jgi:ABC-2 type transport system ATP-binding protein
MLAAQGIEKSFGTIRAVRGVSFNVAKGEIFGIVGPDGAGKSTLLKILASTLEPDKGRITIAGVDLSSSLFAAREHIAYMPQKFGLYEDLTVEENIRFFGKLFGASDREIKERSVRLYEFSRLKPFSDRLAGKLSGGMKQKLGLACALIHTPSLLILDEPTNGVDPVSRREFWMILYDLLSEGVSIVVSTAYLDEAERCSRVALMNGGQFMTVDTLHGIKESVGERFIIAESEAARDAELILKKALTRAHLIRTGNSVRGFIPDDRKDYRTAATTALKKAGIKAEIRYAVPSLEDCFNELIRRETK